MAPLASGVMGALPVIKFKTKLKMWRRTSASTLQSRAEVLDPSVGKLLDSGELDLESVASAWNEASSTHLQVHKRARNFKRAACLLCGLPSIALPIVALLEQDNISLPLFIALTCLLTTLTIATCIVSHLYANKKEPLAEAKGKVFHDVRRVLEEINRGALWRHNMRAVVGTEQEIKTYKNSQGHHRTTTVEVDYLSIVHLSAETPHHGLAFAGPGKDGVARVVTIAELTKGTVVVTV